jgi:ribosomal protein S18 acetylase RimI-like enzyme
MPEPTNTLTLRPATDADQKFLVGVFASTRADELQALAWNPAQAQAFIDMQFNAQQRSYAAGHPSAENNIIVFDDQPIGRMLVDRSGDSIHLVDIAILTDYRNRHFGSTLIQGLFTEAAACGKRVELSVFKGNPAARLYERLGFLNLGESGSYLRMSWHSDAPSSSS